MSRDGRTWLSHSGIEILQRCPRCFWLHYKKGIRQPEGIVSRLANRFDKVLKNYFDSFRPELPPMVEGKLKGRLQDPFVETYFVQINSKYGFLGKLDECLVNEKGEHIPVDFKTASSDPREKETLAAYQSQIDDYVFVLRQNKKPVAGFGYLIYFFPDHSKELHRGFPMIIHLVKVVGNPAKSAKRIASAIDILEGKIPKPSKDCSFCSWWDQVNQAVGSSGIELTNPAKT